MIFVWIPKTGGTSLFSYFAEQGMKLFTEKYWNFDNIGSVSFGHADIREIIKADIINPFYYMNNEKVVVIRNPYDRFISLYFDFIKSKRFSGTLIEFANVIRHSSRKIGMYNVLDYSQCANQCDWILPDFKIIRFEDIGKVFPSLNHLNKGEHDSYVNYYDSELKKLVYEIYLLDFVSLKYSFDL